MLILRAARNEIVDTYTRDVVELRLNENWPSKKNNLPDNSSQRIGIHQTSKAE